MSAFSFGRGLLTERAFDRGSFGRNPSTPRLFLILYGRREMGSRAICVETPEFSSHLDAQAATDLYFRSSVLARCHRHRRGATGTGEVLPARNTRYHWHGTPKRLRVRGAPTERSDSRLTTGRSLINRPRAPPRSSVALLPGEANVTCPLPVARNAVCPRRAGRRRAVAKRHHHAPVRPGHRVEPSLHRSSIQTPNASHCHRQRRV